MNTSKKLILIIIGIVLAVVLLFVAIIAGTNNKAIGLEEQVTGAKASVSIAEKKRLDLIVNVADSAKAYSKHEAKTLKSIVKGRTGEAGDKATEKAKVKIDALVEAYPELKASEGYKDFRTSLETVENQIKDERNNYTVSIRTYNKYIRKFPSNIILDMTGYEKIKFQYLNFEGAEEAPTNYFGE